MLLYRAIQNGQLIKGVRGCCCRGGYLVTDSVQPLTGSFERMWVADDRSKKNGVEDQGGGEDIQDCLQTALDTTYQK